MKNALTRIKSAYVNTTTVSRLRQKAQDMAYDHIAPITSKIYSVLPEKIPPMTRRIIMTVMVTILMLVRAVSMTR